MYICICTQVVLSFLCMHLELPSPKNGDPDRCQDSQTDRRTDGQLDRQADGQKEMISRHLSRPRPRTKGNRGTTDWALGRAGAGVVELQAQAQAQAQKQQASCSPSKSRLRV